MSAGLAHALVTACLVIAGLFALTFVGVVVFVVVVFVLGSDGG